MHEKYLDQFLLLYIYNNIRRRKRDIQSIYLYLLIMTNRTFHAVVVV